MFNNNLKIIIFVKRNIIFFASLNDEYERAVRFEVTVEEDLTTRSQNVSAVVLLHKYKYKLELIKTSEYFKPGLKYSAYVRSYDIIYNIYTDILKAVEITVIL